MNEVNLQIREVVGDAWRDCLAHSRLTGLQPFFFNVVKRMAFALSSFALERKGVQISVKQAQNKRGRTDLFYFALGAIRTRDLSLKRGVLYLLSYKRINYLFTGSGYCGLYDHEIYIIKNKSECQAVCSLMIFQQQFGIFQPKYQYFQRYFL